MAKPYSDDLRARIGAAVRDGYGVREAETPFGVSPAKTSHFGQRMRECGSATAKAMGGAKRDVLADEKDSLRSRIKAEPDPTLDALVAELVERGLKVGRWAVWNFCRVEKLTFKKVLLPSEQDRPSIVRLRELWRQLQSALSRKRFVFVDETWAKTNMTGLYGRSLRGTRLHAKVPHGHWKTLTFTAALRSDRIIAPCVFDQAINATSFLARAKQALVPTLLPGDRRDGQSQLAHKYCRLRRHPGRRRKVHARRNAATT